MGYAVYEVGDRDAGYGVPSICDHPDCNERIDRGLSYICGGEPASDSRGCNLYFCAKHLAYYNVRQHGKLGFVQLCERCGPRMRKPFTAKPDLPEWIEHKATDPSWAAWRRTNELKGLRKAIATLESFTRDREEVFHEGSREEKPHG